MTNTDNFNMDEIALCKGCGTSKHLNPEGLCGRCVKTDNFGELRLAIQLVLYPSPIPIINQKEVDLQMGKVMAVVSGHLQTQVERAEKAATAEHYRLEGALWILNQLHKSPKVIGRSMEVIEAMRQQTVNRLATLGENRHE